MNIAIVGATGNVGRKLLEVLEKLNFKFDQLYLIASYKSIGKKVSFKNNFKQLVNHKVCLCFFYLQFSIQ